METITIKMQNQLSDNIEIQFNVRGGVDDSEMIEKIQNIHKEAIKKLIKNNPKIKENSNVFNNIKINVELNERMRSCAGKAQAGHTIKINYRMHIDNPSELEDTYIHELAHILCHREKKNEPRYDLFTGKRKRGDHHGKHWQKMMKDMGIEPKRTHNLDVEKYRNKRNKFLYKCECGPIHKVSSILHNRMNKGQSRRCRKCKTTISFIKAI